MVFLSQSQFHILLRRRLSSHAKLLLTLSRPKPFSSLPQTPPPPPSDASSPKPSSLSARMSFVFDQIDAIERSRQEKDHTLQRIRAWRQSKSINDPESLTPKSPAPESAVGSYAHSVEEANNVEPHGSNGVTLSRKEVELAHPWPEWLEFMERLVQQNYFDHKRKDEDKMIEDLGFSVSEAVEDQGFDFTRDFKTVQNAVLNFGRDRFDILKSFSRRDLQILVGYGCPSSDKRVTFSAKVLRKHVHLDEGDICSSCKLRSACDRAYLLTNKEDEARTIDVMRVLLMYGFDPINGSVANKPLLKIKSVKTVVRKLLHEVVKLSAVPIDPNLAPPVIKKPPPKVKQPPPPPKKRVGRDDIEMKKGDWLCPKCDFMNFAKNTVCLQCDATRPKRQLLPGEWECPQCNFLNYRRNVVCFHCECKRPPDEFPQNQLQERQRGPSMKLDKVSRQPEISSAWNFDFDDDESDGADVAAFEYADSSKIDEDFLVDKQAAGEASRAYEDGTNRSGVSRMYERDHSSALRPMNPRMGFNDFDEEDDDVDNYEVDTQNGTQRTGLVKFSELEDDSDSDDLETSQKSGLACRQTSLHNGRRPSRPGRQNFSSSIDDEIDFSSDDDLPVHPDWKSSQRGGNKLSSSSRGGSGRQGGFRSQPPLSYMESADEGGFNRARQTSERSRRNTSPMARAPMTTMDRRRNNSFENDFDESAHHPSRSSRDSYSSRSRRSSRVGRSNNDNRSDSYYDDERFKRPRVNVR